MKTTKITGDQVALLRNFQAVRVKKNEFARDEKNSRKALDVQIPELAQKYDEYSLLFNGAPVAIWKQSERVTLDQGKLQAEFPEAYAACNLPGPVWSLDVLL